MPRIADTFTNIAAYIYASLDDAKNGYKSGGSGFLVSVPFETNSKWSAVYVITNRHVVISTKTPIVRLNRKDGNVEFLPTERNNWMLHPDGDDVAALPFPLYKHLLLNFLPVDK